MFSETAQNKTFQNKYVLIGTNQARLRELIRSMFEEMKTVKIIEAMSGHSILEHLQTYKLFDNCLVIIDFDMPNITGIKATQEIRNHPEFENLPILALTSETDGRQVTLACEIGASGCLLKPFPAKMLFEKFDNIIKSRANPPDHVKLIIAGKKFYNDGDYDKALALFEKSRELSNSARVVVHMGETHSKKEAYDKAKSLFDEALDLNPNYLKAYSSAANMFLFLEDYTSAREYMEKAVAISPDNPERNLLFGNTCLKIGEKNKADSAFSSILKQDPSRAKEIGKIYLDAGDLKKAEELFRQHLNDPDVDHRDTFNKLALSLKRQGLWEKAIEEYRKAIFKYPDDEVLYFNRGKAYLQGGQKEKARENFIKAVELNPEFEEAIEELDKLKSASC